MTAPTMTLRIDRRCAECGSDGATAQRATRCLMRSTGVQSPRRNLHSCFNSKSTPSGETEKGLGDEERSGEAVP
jgi:hypothetical protein